MKKERYLPLLLMLCGLLARPAAAQWTYVSGPSGDVMYLSAYGSGIVAQTTTGFFASSDMGMHWVKADAPLADSLISMFPTDTVNYLVGNFLGQLPPLPDTLKNLQTADLDLSSLSAFITSLSILYPPSLLDSIYVSLDTGRTAMKISEILSQLASYAAGIDTEEVLSQIDSAQVWLYSDGASEWIRLRDIMSAISVRGMLVTENHMFACTNRGVFRASHMGLSWQQFNAGLSDTNVYAVAGTDAVVFAATGSGVFTSTDDGLSWNAASKGLTNTDVRALAFLPGDNVFAGTHGGGVFVSTNNASSWYAANTGLTSMNINALSISGEYLFAGTAGGGLWMRPLRELLTAIHGNPGEPPITFRLQQNYPNPFNPSTTISYQLSAVSQVTLKVYDVLGREVATLVKARQSAGSHTVVFDAGRLPSGVYFYTIRAGGYTATKRLMLLK